MDHTANISTANAVARVENLEFLTDVVPKTQTYKQVKAKMAAKEPAAKANGQRTLDQHMGDAGHAQATNGASHDPDSMDVDADAAGPSGTTVPIGKLGNEVS